LPSPPLLFGIVSFDSTTFPFLLLSPTFPFLLLSPTILPVVQVEELPFEFFLAKVFV
jgi:hypothetical protein